MEELIQQYIEQAEAFIEKQAKEIASLNEAILEVKSSHALAKKSSEDTLSDLISCLSNGQYKQESIVNALKSSNTGLLEKESEEEEIEDSWGELDNSTDVSHNNIRPSDRQLYSRFGLI